MSKRFYLGLLISICFLLLGVWRLADYGINWDEPVHFMRGEAFLHYFLTGKKDYSDLPEFKNYYQNPATLFFDPIGVAKNKIQRRSMYQYEGLPESYWASEKSNEATHPPLGGELAAFFNYIFFEKLGFINDNDSYHLFIIFIAAALVGYIFFWTATEYGTLAGMVSALSLALYPLFLGESHFNVKDVPEAVFYSLTILIFYKAVKYRNSKLMFASAIFCGLALATKYNIAFASIILFIWFTIYLIASRRNLKSFLSLTLPIALYVPIAFSILIASWPLMWSAPFKIFSESLRYYQLAGIGGGFDQRYLTIFDINTYPIQWILFTTPLVILFFSLFGIFYTLRFGFKEKHKTSLLVLIWFLVPILRVTVPNTSIYGGVRQIMEYIPAMAILSGIGAGYIVKLLNDYTVKKLKKQNNNLTIKQFNNQTIKFAFQLLIILSFIPITLKLISIHPNEGVYFNPLIGGLSGAVKKDIPASGESLGNPYKQALTWLNEHADKEAKLSLTYGTRSNLPSIFIRPDIEFRNQYRAVDTSMGEYVIGLTNKSSLFSEMYYARYLNTMIKPLFESSVDGVSLVAVWKNDAKYLKPEYKNEHIFAGEFKIRKEGTTIFIDLGKTITLRKVVFSFQSTKCEKNGDVIIGETSLDSIHWKDSDNSIGRDYILAAGAFSDFKYQHYFVAEKARYIEFDYSRSPTSCLAGFSNVEIVSL